MKLSEMVKAIENNQGIKDKFINNCIDKFGSDIIEKPKKIYAKIETKEIEWWNDIAQNDNLTDDLLFHDLITTLGIKEYNVKRVLKLIVQGYTTSEIIKELHIGYIKLKKIKQLIYEKTEQARQENRI